MTLNYSTYDKKLQTIIESEIRNNNLETKNKISKYIKDIKEIPNITLWTSNQGGISTKSDYFDPRSGLSPAPVYYSFTVSADTTQDAIAQKAAELYKQIGVQKATPIEEVTRIYKTKFLPNSGSITEITGAINNAQLIKEDNIKKESLNKAYNDVQTIANSTTGGDYVKQRDLIRKLEGSGLTSTVKSTLENTYKAFYSTEKLQQWNSALGAKPPYGTFDPNYYKTQYPAVSQQWASAVANDDIDITQRYGENGFYLQHYSTQGKAAGARGNKEEVTSMANQYVENTPTDKDLELAKSLQLGVNTDTQTDRLLKIPTVAS